MTEAVETQTAAAVQPAPINEFVAMVKQSFHFKTEKIKNEKGEAIGEGKKHPSVEIFLPIPKASRLVEFLQNPGNYAKELDLLTGAVTDIIYKAARQQINELREKDPSAIVTPASLNYEKLDWAAIANMPKSERGTYVPSDEDLKSFCEAYLAVMPIALEKDKSKIENHIVIFQSNFKKQRANKEMLEFFANCLTVFLGSADAAVVEDNMEVVEYYQGRLARMLKTEEKITMDDL